MLIGGRERRKIVIADYDPRWPEELRVREPGHLMFRTPAHDVHVHIWRDSDPEVGRHLRFRDRLRTSPADRAAYEGLKRRLARREWSDGNDYAEAKTELIQAILARA